jgi:hypothetical protein
VITSTYPIMGRGVKIPWIEGSKHHGKGVKIPWIGVGNSMGRGVKIPRVGGGQYTMDRG